MVFIDEATHENGCLQVLPRSNLLGRQEHERLDSGTDHPQQGIHPDRVAEILRTHTVREVPGSPGSLLFFHSNLMHCSQDNRSDRSRNAAIIALNAMSNQPPEGQGQGDRQPVVTCADDALQQWVPA